jgi:hypothetical protein
MKLPSFIFVLGLSSLVQANNFYTEYLACKGQLQGELPKGLRKEYAKMALVITSFWSVKKDCSLAPSVKIAFSNPNHLNFSLSDKEILYSLVKGGDSWYLPPMAFSDKQIIVRDTDLSDGKPLILTINEDKEDVIKLTGVWNYFLNTDSYFEFECLAKKTNPDQLQIINKTKTCNNYPKQKELKIH